MAVMFLLLPYNIWKSITLFGSLTSSHPGQSLTPTASLKSPVNMTARLWTCGRKPGTQREPTQTSGEHAGSSVTLGIEVCCPETLSEKIDLLVLLKCDTNPLH